MACAVALALGKLVAQVATLATAVVVVQPMGVPPSLKVTLAALADPDPGGATLTVAVNVTVCPTTAEVGPARLVVVAACPTGSAMAVELEVVKFVSPA